MSNLFRNHVVAFIHDAAYSTIIFSVTTYMHNVRTNEFMEVFSVSSEFLNLGSWHSESVFELLYTYKIWRQKHKMVSKNVAVSFTSD